MHFEKEDKGSSQENTALGDTDPTDSQTVGKWQLMGKWKFRGFEIPEWKLREKKALSFLSVFLA